MQGQAEVQAPEVECIAARLAAETLEEVSCQMDREVSWPGFADGRRADGAGTTPLVAATDCRPIGQQCQHASHREATPQLAVIQSGH
jgi:hypothetical protein